MTPRIYLAGKIEKNCWRHAVPPAPIIPKPISLHGRNYFPADAIDDWVQAQAEAAVNPTAIPDADQGRAKGLSSVATHNQSRKGNAL